MRICTTNPNKVAEFGGLLAPIDIRLIPTALDFPETEKTFSDNAVEKAMNYARVYPGEWLLSEDSGLVVPALDGRPGPYSARFADLELTAKGPIIRESHRGREEMDRANNIRVLEMMADVPQHQRGAYFVCYTVVIDPQGNRAFEVERRAYGQVIEELRGDGGFGYDPIFMSAAAFGRTWAELDSARKNLMSHRSKAIWDLMAWLCSTSRDIS